MKRSTVRQLAMALVCLALAASVSAQTTEFTYQGSLSVSGSPATGSYDFEFLLFDAVSDGAQQGTTLSKNAVTVTSGVFSVTLDFGNQFPGSNRFLEIHVKQSGDGAFTSLTPRQSISSALYAVRSLSATTADAVAVSGVPAGSDNYIQNQNATVQAANFNVNGNGLIGGQVGIGTTSPMANVKLQVENVQGAILGNSSSSTGVFGQSIIGNGVSGYSTGGFGVYGFSQSSSGVYGETSATDSQTLAGVSGKATGKLGIGVLGNGTGNNSFGVVGRGITGVYGISTVGIGVAGDSTSSIGVRGTSTSGSGVTGFGAVGVEAGAFSSGQIAVKASGSSWFAGDTTPLNPALTGNGTGIVIGSAGPFGYISAVDYSVFQSRTLSLNLGGGNVGIGTTTPDQVLSVNGNASKTGGSSWLTFSDERLKNIKGRYRPGLAAVMRLQPLSYEYKKDNALGLKSDGAHVGFSAQEVEKVIPEAVTKTESGYRMVNNDPIVLAMLNSIKEQQKEIEKLQEEIRQLRSKRRWRN
jgi:hypothetical protein